jgi:hypothetical protein
MVSKGSTSELTSSLSAAAAAAAALDAWHAASVFFMRAFGSVDMNKMSRLFPTLPHQSVIGHAAELSHSILQTASRICALAQQLQSMLHSESPMQHARRCGMQQRLPCQTAHAARRCSPAVHGVQLRAQ